MEAGYLVGTAGDPHVLRLKPPAAMPLWVCRHLAPPSIRRCLALSVRWPEDASMKIPRLDLLDAVPYLRAYAGQIFVVKVGGELLLDPTHRDCVARDLAVLHRLGIQTILVHGGGPQLDAALERAGIETERVAGRRITCQAAIDAAVREWRGHCSAQWVTALHAQGESAIGLSGPMGPTCFSCAETARGHDH